MSGTPTVALVTGAGGFAGRHLIAELERETDWDIVGLRMRARVDGARTRILSCDLRDRDLVDRVVARYRPNIVFHLAAQSYVPKAFASPGDTITNNALAQINLLEALRAARLDPLVLIVGSSEEYGFTAPEDLPLHEEQPFRPGNPYAVSKITQDMLGLQYWLAFGMRVVRVRPFNHFGPGQSERFVLANFARQIVEAGLGRIEPVVLTGDLDAERDFLDVRDVARAYRLAVLHGVPGEVYNIASGLPRRVGDLLERMVALSGVPVTIRRDPARLRPVDVPRVMGDASKFHAATGWTPRIALDQSLADTLAYWRATLATYDEHNPDEERTLS